METQPDGVDRLPAERHVFDRCVGFVRGFAERRATRVAWSEHGLALFDDQLPKAWDLNVLWLVSAASASAYELAAEADRLQGGANLAHRRVIACGVAGARLAPEFDALGWQYKSFLVMPQTCTGQPIDVTRVVELTAAELESFWVEGIRKAPWADHEVVRQLSAAQGRRRRAAQVRYFALRVDRQIASTCELFCHDRVAQVESVMTVEHQRGKGYASSVISRATTEARATGHELVFVLADASDRAQQLYRSLGFQPAGRIWQFTRLPT